MGFGLAQAGNLERRRVFVHDREHVGHAEQIVKDLKMVSSSLCRLERPRLVLQRRSRLS